MIYIASQNANYAHLFMYLVGLTIERKILNSKYPFRSDYSTHFVIDMNVVEFDVNTDDQFIMQAFTDAIKRRSFSDEEIIFALEKISLRLAMKYKIKDLKKIKDGLATIKSSLQPPKQTDDSLECEGLRFYGKRKIRRETIDTKKAANYFNMPATRIINLENSNMLASSNDYSIEILIDESNKINLEILINNISDRMEKWGAKQH